MRYFLIVLLLCAASPLMAQIGRGGKHAARGGEPKGPDTDKQREEAQRRAQKAAAEKERDEKEAERETAKAEREAKKSEKEGVAAPEEIKPGDVIAEEVKLAWIEAEMDKLAIESKTTRTSFSKLVLKAWKDSEAEDARYAKEYEAAKDDAKLLDPARKAHQEKLKKIWDDLDSEATKKRLLDDIRLKAWQTDSKFLREKTATDKFEEQEKAKLAKKQPKKKAEERPEGETPEKGN
ncbi:MAG: hypothetical protein IT461_06790 [Planctomycetes bacterium]|nr:hypothetical protein [Planctomycetota bacterium]